MENTIKKDRLLDMQNSLSTIRSQITNLETSMRHIREVEESLTIMVTNAMEEEVKEQELIQEAIRLADNTN